MAIDLFDSRTMMAALEETFPPKTFLRDTFFGGVETSNTKYVDVDIRKGKRKMAPFVSPKHEGKPLDRAGYTTKTYAPPYIKPFRTTAAEEIFKRPMGSHVYAGNATPAQRAAAELGKDLSELQEEIVRREEWMCAQLLLDGTLTVTGEGINDTLDFGLDPTHQVTLAGTALWTDTANSTPLENLRAWKRTVAKDSGIVPTVAVMGENVVDAFLSHADVRNVLDNRRLVMGAIDTSHLSAMGASYIGTIEELSFYAYNEWFEDAGATSPMVPVDRIFLGNPNSRAAMHYGAIQDLEVGTASVRYFPKSWTQPNPSARFVMVQSAPLPVPIQIDAFMSIKAV
ncbi:MAG: major capsid protein [Nitrospirota bacterium]|nr:major capsid protein [Nitrospirota bacterium]